MDPFTGQGQRASFIETTKRLITGDPTARFNGRAWEQEAIAAQRQISTLLGNRDWDLIRSGADRQAILTMKVGCVIFGLPKLPPDDANRQTGYSKQQLEHIDKLCKQMTEAINEDEDIHFALVYIIVGFDKKINNEEYNRLKREIQSLERKIASSENEQDDASNELLGRMRDHNNREKLRIAQERMKEDYSLPVFKCRSSTSSSYVVVDSWHARRYTSWDNFIAEENLPELCRFCAPKGGKYKHAEMEFHYPRANSTALLDKLLTIAEWTGIVASFVFPFAGLVIVSAAAGAKIYVAGSAIVDRYKHGQSIGFEAFQHWLRIGLCCLKIATVAFEVVHVSFGLEDTAESLLAIRGLRLAVTCLDTQHASIHVFGIANLIAELMKHARVRKLNSSDFVDLFLACLTFANVSLKFKESSTGEVIKQAQRDFLNFTRAALSGSEDTDGSSSVLVVYHKFKRVLADQMHRVSDFVQACQNFEIENTMDLIRAMSLDPNNPKAFAEIGKHFKNGKLCINKQKFYAPIKWLHVDEQTRLDLYHSIQQYHSNMTFAATQSETAQAGAIRKSAKQDHETDVMEIGESFQISFPDLHGSIMATLCTKYSESFGVKPHFTNPDQILVSGRPIFAKLSRHQMTRLAQVWHESLDIDNRVDLLRLVHEFAEYMKCRAFNKYLKYAEFFATKFYEKRTKILNNFRQELLDGKTLAQVLAHIGGLLGLKKVRGPLIKLADDVVVRQFQGAHRGVELKLQNLRDAYNKSLGDSYAKDNFPQTGCESGVLSPDLASHRYQRHKYFGYVGQRQRTFGEDLDLVESALGRSLSSVPENAVRVQNSSGTCTVVTFECEVYGTTAAVINKWFDEDDNKTSGIITILTYTVLDFESVV